MYSYWPTVANMNTRFSLLLGSMGITVLVYWSGLFHAEAWPRTFVEGVGLTRFKVITEYVITAILVIPTIRFYRMARLRQFDGATWLLSASVLTLCVRARACVRARQRQNARPDRRYVWEFESERTGHRTGLARQCGRGRAIEQA